MQLWNLAWFIPGSFTEVTLSGLQIPATLKPKDYNSGTSHVYHTLAACLWLIIHPYMCLILCFVENTIVIEIRKIYQMKSAGLLWATQQLSWHPFLVGTLRSLLYSLYREARLYKGASREMYLMWIETAVSGKGSLSRKLIWLRGYEIIFDICIKEYYRLKNYLGVIEKEYNKYSK